MATFRVRMPSIQHDVAEEAGTILRARPYEDIDIAKEFAPLYDEQSLAGDCGTVHFLTQVNVIVRFLQGDYICRYLVQNMPEFCITFCHARINFLVQFLALCALNSCSFISRIVHDANYVIRKA